MFCVAGTYCPVGTSYPIDCPRGQYCGMSALELPSGDCHEGYYCNGSATVPDPMECDPGYYCPEGTATQLSCEPGTFRGKFVYYLHFS